MSLMSFEEVLSIASSGKKHVLLGNGFSIACRRDIFSYDSLYDSASFEDHSEKLRPLFKSLKTTDFEVVMRSLEEAVQVMSVYEPERASLIEQFIADRQSLRSLLVTTLTKHHPDSPDEIAEAEYVKCQAFLSHFDNIYSLNYDLLLYWTTMKFQELKDDGFRDPFFGDSKDYVEESYVAWINNNHKQNIYYLHGALHLFMSVSEVQKYCWSRTGTRLLSQIDRALKEGKFPLVVAESETGKKMGKIQRSGYLNHAFRSLGNISGNLFIYGHSLADNDAHILQQIARNKSLKRIFISIFGNPADKANRDIITKGSNLRTYRGRDNGKEIFFYDAASANVWR